MRKMIVGKYKIIFFVFLFYSKICLAEPLWSILIPTLDERKAVFDRLYNSLTQQIAECGLQEQVEIIVSCDNRQKTIGTKRNELLHKSQARYICYVDDDDTVHEQYVAMIYQALLTNPDCVSLKGIITFNGTHPHTFIHSIQYSSWYEQDSVYYRPPNHLNPILRSIAVKFLFPENNYGEDADWSMQIQRSQLLKKEAQIDEPYYFYCYTTK